MNEEIKEILDRFNKGHDELTVEEYILLENYITNLQQAIEIKNQRIKEEQQEKERYMKFYNGLNKWNKKLQQENEKLKYNARGQANNYFKDKYADEVLKNAELQQDLDKAIDTIEKDRQFYKCRMDEYVELKKENERLNQNNQLYQEEMARTWKIANDYKSRCEKANTYINEEIKKIQEHQYSTGVRRLTKIQNILNRSDENE